MNSNIALLRIVILYLLLSSSSIIFAQCPDCCNNVQDCSETGIDCGGPDCMPCDNLVPNGSFECTPNCFVIGTGQIESATPWTYVDVTEPSDLFNSCFTFDANIQTPDNLRGTQAPKTGAGYAGFQAQDLPTGDPRAGYVQVTLNSPLVAGTSYDLSFWVSPADNFGMTMGGIGAYFSVGQVAPGDNAPLNLHGINAHIESDLFVHITDVTIWTEVTGSYVAAGGEDHIVLGNFKTTFSPPSPLVTYTCCNSSLSYYYIDDVVLLEGAPLPIELLNFSVSKKDSYVSLKWNTTSELNNSFFEIERSNDGINFTVIGTVDGAGNSTIIHHYDYVDHSPLPGSSYYRLKQVDFDGKSTLSHMVSVVRTETNVNIYPNPTTGEIIAQFGVKVDNITITLTNSFGQLILTKHYKSTKQINLNVDAPRGLYFLKIETSTGTSEILKIIKK